MNFINNKLDFQQFVAKQNNTVIYGCGNLGAHFCDILFYKKIKVLAFCDNYKNGGFEGINIFKPAEACKQFSKALFIIANQKNYTYMYQDLIKNNIPVDNIYILIPNDELFSYFRIIPHSFLSFETHLVDHCNLNCSGCCHFSPLSEKKFADIKLFEKNFSQLSHIFHGNSGQISLLGGEPLLHPDINKFMEVARNNFPKSKICIITNGILLPSMAKDFWEYCNHLNISILITKYPINLDIDKIKHIATLYDVKLQYYNEDVKTFTKFTLDLDGSQKEEENFMHCSLANQCITLKQNGDLYTCSTAAHISIFKNYFNKKFDEFSNNCINIYEETNPKKILKFLSKPIPMCKYCDIKHQQNDIEWSISKKKISEWI